jgi:hypothetical protein
MQFVPHEGHPEGDVRGDKTAKGELRGPKKQRSGKVVSGLNLHHVGLEN